MKQHLGLITFLVKDYDEAVEYFTTKLQFDLIEDTKINDIKRWVIVAPKRSNESKLLLAKATSDEQLKNIGNQTGGRVTFFLHTDNFERDFARMIKSGVDFIEEPREEKYGTVAIFKDLYGNKWDFLQLK